MVDILKPEQTSSGTIRHDVCMYVCMQYVCMQYVCSMYVCMYVCMYVRVDINKVIVVDMPKTERKSLR